MIKRYDDFKKSIINIISNSGLDVGIVYYIIKDIYKEIENMYYSQINLEINNALNLENGGSETMDE